jgi:hypothetical protein
MLNFLKKKDENTPPDVGQEEETNYKEDTDNNEGNPYYSSYENVPEKPAAGNKRFNKNFRPISEPPIQQSFYPPVQQSFSEERSNIELEKINARLEVMNSMIKSFNERFSLINQQIGEIRTMSVSNEKNLSLSNLDAKKVIELVKEVNPEKLRLDYRRADFKVETLAEKLESNKQFIDSIMEELKDLKRRANLFEGTDALLKLNEDVKKDLIEIQKTNSRVRMNADKSEQIFIELNKGFQENQKINQIITNLDTSYSGIKKEIEKLNLDYKNILNVNDFNDFKKALEVKFIILEHTISDIERLKNESDKFSNIIKKILFMEKRNEEDIANLGLSSGNSNVKKINDYEQKLLSFLEVIDKMTLEISRIKEKIGLKTPRNEKSLSPMNVRGNYFNSHVKEEEKLNPLPEGNFEEKTELISAPMLHINLDENMAEDTREENINNENEINDLLSKGENCLANNDFAGAVKIYEEISDLYNPAEDDNNLIYPKIIGFYDNLSSSINKPIFIPLSYGNEFGALPRKNLQYKKLNDY